MTDWEKRTLDLFEKVTYNFNADHCRDLIAQSFGEVADARAEEIAQKIEDGRCVGHVATDPSCWTCRLRVAHAHIARSFISKKSEPEKPTDKPYQDDFLREQQLIQKTRDEAYDRGWREGQEAERTSVVCVVPVDEAAIRADEREKCNAITIGARGELWGNLPCGHPTCSIDMEPGNMAPFCEGCRRANEERPQSREEVLEVALRFLCVCRCGAGNELGEAHSASCPVTVASRALDWKPNTPDTSPGDSQEA